MKNFKIIIPMLVLFIPVSIQAQSTWFIPNHAYNFNSLNGNDSTETISITVVYDQNMNASVWMNTATALSSDKETFFSFGAPSEWSVSYDTITYKITSGGPDTGSYYIIGFDGSTTYSALGGNCVSIHCKCVAGAQDASCDVSYMTNKNGHFSGTCIQGAGCARCKLSVTDCGTKSYNGGTLVIKANSITMN